MPVMMKCARNYTLRTTLGHTIVFKADEATAVPDEVVDLALAVNIIPVDGKYTDKPEDAGGTVRQNKVSPFLREALVLHAIDALVRENNTDHFDGGGRPKAHSLTDLSGVSVTASERNKFWDKYRDMKGTAQELPSPPNLDLVMDAQQLSSKASMYGFAEDVGVSKSDLKGLTLREMKAILVGAAANYRQTATIAEEGESALDEE